MGSVFKELNRVTSKGGFIAFEVGEVRKGSIRLDEHVVPLAIDAGLTCEGVLINAQSLMTGAGIHCSVEANSISKPPTSF